MAIPAIQAGGQKDRASPGVIHPDMDSCRRDTDLPEHGAGVGWGSQSPSEVVLLSGRGLGHSCSVTEVKAD